MNSPGLVDDAGKIVPSVPLLKQWLESVCAVNRNNHNKNDSTVGLLANSRLCLSEKDGNNHYSFLKFTSRRLMQVSVLTICLRLSVTWHNFSQHLILSLALLYVTTPLLSVFGQKTWWSGMNLSIRVSPPTVLSGMSQTTSSKREVEVVFNAVNPVSSLSITSANCGKELRSFQHPLVCTMSLQVLIMRYQG